MYMHNILSKKCLFCYQVKPYSINLRSQIVTAYENKKGSMLKLAGKYGVSRSFVQKIIKQAKTTGNIQPIGNGNRDSKLQIEKYVRDMNYVIPQDGCKIKVFATTITKDIKLLLIVLSGNQSVSLNYY